MFRADGGIAMTRSATISAFWLLLASAALPGGARAEVPPDCKQLNKPDLTVESCTRFIEAAPGDKVELADAHFYRGTAFGMQKQLDQAIADFDKSIELRPDWSPAHANRARAYVGKDEPARAIPSYDRAIELAPRDSGLYVNRALAYIKLKDSDRALQDFERAIEINPRNAFAIFNAGGIHERKGDKDRAIAEYRKALVLAPGNKIIAEASSGSARSSDLFAPEHPVQAPGAAAGEGDVQE